MGKSSGKKKQSMRSRGKDVNSKSKSSVESDWVPTDEDREIFIEMAQQLKEEGNQLFQMRDYDGAMFKYDKAIRLLPKYHNDVAYLHSNMAACYMQKGSGDYRKGLEQCNLALEVSHKYSKALLKRARCYEALNRLDYALNDVGSVLRYEPNNLMAQEIAERIRKALEKKGIQSNDFGIFSSSQSNGTSVDSEDFKEKTKKKNQEAKTDFKVVVEERQKNAVPTDGKGIVLDHSLNCKVVKENNKKMRKLDSEIEINAVVDGQQKADGEIIRSIKLVLGEDIRWAQMPANCSVPKLREIIRNRFTKLKAFLIKYKDHEGDLVTVTATEELRFAEASAGSQGTIRFFIVEVTPEQDPLFIHNFENEIEADKLQKSENRIEAEKLYKSENGEESQKLNKSEKGIETEKPQTSENGGSSYVDDWIVDFAQLFKNYVGFDSDGYIKLHDVGMRLYSEAIEDTVTSEEAQGLFDIAEEKFQEMAALALFNWGNVHMSKARKRVPSNEDSSQEAILEEVRKGYDWAEKEYEKAGNKYVEAISIKPDFYEGYLALGQQEFELAKLTWYFELANKGELDERGSAKVIDLFEQSQENIARGTEMWEKLEEHRAFEISNSAKEKMHLEQKGLNGLIGESLTDDTSEIAPTVRSQINILWGTVLYERSIFEFKLGTDIWEDYLEASIDRFEHAGASEQDIGVMIKNHCSNATAQEGLTFKIDEIVQAWNEMYDAKKWRSGVASFRLEPLLRRRVSKLHHLLEHL